MEKEEQSSYEYELGCRAPVEFRSNVLPSAIGCVDLESWLLKQKRFSPNLARNAGRAEAFHEKSRANRSSPSAKSPIFRDQRQMDFKNV